jgi:hypothetical protein
MSSSNGKHKPRLSPDDLLALWDTPAGERLDIARADALVEAATEQVTADPLLESLKAGSGIEAAVATAVANELSDALPRGPETIPPQQVAEIIEAGEKAARRRTRRAAKQARKATLADKSSQMTEPELPSLVAAIPVASTFREIFLSIGGVERAMQFLLFAKDEAMKQAAVAWKELDIAERLLAMDSDPTYVESFLLAHGVDPNEAFGRICMKIREYAISIAQVLHDAGKPLQVQKSISVSLQDGDLAQRERMRHLESGGMFALPKAATMINVSASAAAQAGVVQVGGGLPGLEDISAESDDWLLEKPAPQALPPPREVVVLDVQPQEVEA